MNKLTKNILKFLLLMFFINSCTQMKSHYEKKSMVKIMGNFQDNYSQLFQFFVCYFSNADFDNLEDKKIVKIYIRDCLEYNNKMLLTNTQKELEEIINKKNETLNKQSFEFANRYFENDTEGLEWLKMVNKELSKYAQKNFKEEKEINRESFDLSQFRKNLKEKDFDEKRIEIICSCIPTNPE